MSKMSKMEAQKEKEFAYITKRAYNYKWLYQQYGSVRPAERTAILREGEKYL